MAFDPIDKSHHNNFITKYYTFKTNACSALYSKKLGQVCMFEKHSKEIKIYSSDMKFREKHKVPLRVEGFILDIAISELNSAIGCTASDA